MMRFRHGNTISRGHLKPWPKIQSGDGLYLAGSGFVDEMRGETKNTTIEGSGSSTFTIGPPPVVLNKLSDFKLSIIKSLKNNNKPKTKQSGAGVSQKLERALHDVIGTTQSIPMAGILKGSKTIDDMANKMLGTVKVIMQNKYPKHIAKSTSLFNKRRGNMKKLMNELIIGTMKMKGNGLYLAGSGIFDTILSQLRTEVTDVFIPMAKLSAPIFDAAGAKQISIPLKILGDI
jgi:hypothetical protein